MNLKALPWACAAAALLPPAAWSASLTQTHLLVYNDVPVWKQYYHGGAYSISGEIYYGMGWNLSAQFDPSLGQLDSLDWAVTLHGELPTSFIYLQPPASVGPGNANESWTMQYLRIGSGSVLGKYFSTGPGPFATSDALSVPVGGTANHILFLDGNLTSHLTNPALLDDFIQGTSLYLDIVSRYNFRTQNADGGPGLPDLQVALAITYNYTPSVAPEPTAAGMFVLGGVAFLAARRRKHGAR